MTTRKLKSQFALVDRALAGARIRNGTISAGYNQVCPLQYVLSISVYNFAYHSEPTHCEERVEDEQEQHGCNTRSLIAGSRGSRCKKVDNCEDDH